MLYGGAETYQKSVNSCNFIPKTTNEHIYAHTYMHNWPNIRTFGIISEVKLIKHAASSLDVSQKMNIYLSGGSHIEINARWPLELQHNKIV